LYTQLPSHFLLTFPCIHKYIIVFIAELSRTNTVIRKNPWWVICWIQGAAWHV
jgi:hypothetical protein